MTSQFCSVRVHKAKAESFLTDKDWEWGEEEVRRQEGFRASVLTWLRSSSSRPAVVVIIIPSYHRPDSSLLVTVPLLWSMDDDLRLTVGCYQWLQYSSHSFIIWDNEPLFPPLTVRLRSTLLVCFLPLFFLFLHNCTVLSPPKPSPFVADIFPPKVICLIEFQNELSSCGEWQSPLLTRFANKGNSYFLSSINPFIPDPLTVFWDSWGWIPPWY